MIQVDRGLLVEKERKKRREGERKIVLCELKGYLCVWKIKIKIKIFRKIFA